MENTASYESALTVKFSVAAKKKLLPVAAWPILEATEITDYLVTEMLLITIGLTCFSVCARTGS